MKKKIKSDEIDLVEVIFIIWNYKFKIVAISFIFVVLTATLNSIFKHSINAKTEIKPITVFENNLYFSYNSLIEVYKNSFNEVYKKRKGNEGNEGNENFQKKLLININRDYLLDLFIEGLQTREIIAEATKKYQIIDRNKFANEEKYLNAVEKKALNLILLKPVNVDESKSGETRLYWSINYNIYDPEKWEKALNYIEIKINDNIKEFLINNFNTTIDNLKILNQYKLEDLELKINNEKIAYKEEINNQLFFLKEQASIARTMNIASNRDIINSTLEVLEYNSLANVFSSSKQTSNPYYLKGYDIIEKEIELIEARVNNDAFTKNLLNLKKQKRTLLNDKSLERIEKAFNNTPIVISNDFKAANIIYKNTKYDSDNLSILLAGICGIVIGIFYILFSNSLQYRKK